MRSSWALLLIGVLAVPGCLESGDDSSDNAGDSESVSTNDSPQDGNQVAGPGEPGSPSSPEAPPAPAPPPMGPPPQDVHIDASDEVLAEAVHVNWSWSAAPGAKHICVQVWIDGYNDTALQLGPGSIFLGSPSGDHGQDFGNGVSLSIGIGSNNTAGSPDLDASWSGEPQVQDDALGDWTLRIDTNDDEGDAPFVGSWRVHVEVLY